MRLPIVTRKRDQVIGNKKKRTRNIVGVFFSGVYWFILMESKKPDKYMDCTQELEKQEKQK